MSDEGQCAHGVTLASPCMTCLRGPDPRDTPKGTRPMRQEGACPRLSDAEEQRLIEEANAMGKKRGGVTPGGYDGDRIVAVLRGGDSLAVHLGMAALLSEVRREAIAECADVARGMSVHCIEERALRAGDGRSHRDAWRHAKGGEGGGGVSYYTTKRCHDRAEACRGDGDYPRIIREHEEAARSDDPEVARIARGFALVAFRRLDDERWRAEAYARLARGEDIAPRRGTYSEGPMTKGTASEKAGDT